MPATSAAMRPSREALTGSGLRRSLPARFKLRIVGSWPMPALGVDCFVMEAPENLPLEPLIERLALDARVESVQAMNLFRVLAHDDPLYPLQPTAGLWHLDELHRVATGKNVRVAAIDSGVELDHPDLAGRVMLARNFVDTRDAVAELHGTAVAGIIGARADNGVGIVGVAPDARLMALRACWQAPRRGKRRRVQQLHPGEGASVRDRQPRQGDQPEPRRSARSSSRAPAGDRRVARHRDRRRGGLAIRGRRLSRVACRVCLPSPPMTCTMRRTRSTSRRDATSRRRSPGGDGAWSAVRRTRPRRWRDWSRC